jgi:hypothetical protein
MCTPCCAKYIYKYESFCGTDYRDEALRTLVRLPKVLNYFPSHDIQIIENLTLKAHLLNSAFLSGFLQPHAEEPWEDEQ